MPKLALSMIVRDCSGTIKACLDSVKGVAQEIVVADTGSVDQTPEIAARCGARVVHVPWEDDFASARNQALAEVHADWVLSLDADERLDRESASLIPALLEANAIGGYLLTLRNYVRSLEDRIWDRTAVPNQSTLSELEPFPAYVEHENVRLFRRDERIRFVGRVHESVGPSIEKCKLGLGRAPVVIHHLGLGVDREARARKNIFYRELGLQKIAEMPDNPQAYLELGLLELDNFGNIPQALEYFERACQLNGKLGVAWFFAGLAHFKLGEHRASLRCMKAAQKQGHLTAFVAETIGDAHYNLGEFPQSVRAYRQAAESSRDPLLVESKLGLAIVRTGGVDAGLAKIREVVERQPHLPELHDRLILSLVWLGRPAEAAAAAEEKLKSVRVPRPEDFIRAATLWANVIEWKRAAALLHVGCLVYPSHEMLKQVLTEVLEQLAKEVQVTAPN